MYCEITASLPQLLYRQKPINPSGMYLIYLDWSALNLEFLLLESKIMHLQNTLEFCLDYKLFEINL